MFDAQISPILEYCSEIWYTNKFCEEIEKIHLAYMKDILKVKRSSSTLALYAELGRFPLKLKIQYQVLKYWQRVISYSDSHILKQAYLSLLELHDRGQVNWCTQVHDILKDLKMNHHWQNQMITDRDLYKIMTLEQTEATRALGKCLSQLRE